MLVRKVAGGIRSDSRLGLGVHGAGVAIDEDVFARVVGEGVVEVGLAASGGRGSVPCRGASWYRTRRT